MSDYISRAKAIEEINKYHMTSGVSNQGTWNECVDVIAHTISEFPSADVRENIHGEWIKIQSGDKDFPESIVCSVCGGENSYLDFGIGTEPIAKSFVKSKYCPNCGARMKGGE